MFPALMGCVDETGPLFYFLISRLPLLPFDFPLDTRLMLDGGGNLQPATGTKAHQPDTERP